MYGECKVCISPKTSNASFWIGPRGRRAKEALSAAGGALGLKGYQSTSWAYTPGDLARVVAIWTDHASRGASAKSIFGAGDENAAAACLSPDALVARRRRTVVVVARDELALVDPQFTVEEMQLFYARMRMRGVTRAGREAY